MIRQRYKEANYINIGTKKTPQFALMGVGFTALDENPSAQTKSRKYVCDKNTSTSISGYSWSTAIEADQIKDDDALDYLINIGKNQLVGEDAETEYIIVDLYNKNEDGTYQARKFTVAIEISSFTNDEGDRGLSGNLLSVGDPVAGTFDVTTKTFTPNSVE